MRVSSSAEEMCTHGGMEPGTCGSRSSASSSAMAAEERRRALLFGDALCWTISGMAARREVQEEESSLRLKRRCAVLKASSLTPCPALLPLKRARELRSVAG
jgi:hypothetical protein